jgi:HAE1 family hydrophobic/amphiphilic exporter-1
MALLRFSMRHRWLIVLACLGILGALPTLMKIVQKSFLPPVEEAEFVVNIRTPEGTTLAATELMTERFRSRDPQAPGCRWNAAHHWGQRPAHAQPRRHLCPPQ